MSERVIIVTGAFGVLGEAVVLALEDEGAAVARLDYAPAPRGARDPSVGGVDLADEAAAREAVGFVVATIGPPTVLVNIAGGFVWETLEDGGSATWQRMFRTNTLTAVTMCKVVLPHLIDRPGAAIVNIGAAAAGRADAGMGAYAASKAAVARLTESLASELAGRDVTVNATLLTIIDTPANRRDMPDADHGQWVKPRAIADVVAFLASAAARSISGASIPVSRGTF